MKTFKGILLSMDDEKKKDLALLAASKGVKIAEVIKILDGVSEIVKTIYDNNLKALEYGIPQPIAPAPIVKIAKKKGHWNCPNCGSGNVTISESAKGIPELECDDCEYSEEI